MSILHKRICRLVRLIPERKVTTYKMVAEIIGTETAAVRTAMKNASEDVPWWRVIKADRSIAERGGARSSEEQRRLLEKERIEFDAEDRVDLTRFGWEQPQTPEKQMKLNKFYIALAVMVAWVVVGLIFVAPWLFATYDTRTAFTYDLLGLIMPFVALSVYVIAQAHLVRWFVSVPVIVVIVALWLLTARNIVVIIRDYL